MRMMAAALACALALTGCDGSQDKEAVLAQCRMSQEAKLAGIPVCMSARGYEPKYSDFCTKMQVAGAFIESCYEYRGFSFRFRRFFGMD